MAYTSIQIDPKIRKELSSLKAYKRETYDEVLSKLLSLVPKGDDEGKYTDAFRAQLLNARLDLVQGKTVKLEEVERQLGL